MSQVPFLAPHNKEWWCLPLGLWEAGGSEVPGHFLLHSKSETSLGYMRPYLKNIRERREEEKEEDMV